MKVVHQSNNGKYMFKLKKSYRFPRPNFSLVWHLQYSFFSPHSTQFTAIPEVVDGALYTETQKQHSIVAPIKKCSGNMQQVYR